MVAPQDVLEVLAWLARHGTKHNRDGMARYGIVAPKVYGVSVANLHKLAKQIGRNHDLAIALWGTEWYEARMLTAFIDEPARVTPAQMNKWARDFDNWAICDTLCMHLFDRTPHSWEKVEQWSTRREEFVKRAAFALIASLALHDKKSPDTPFMKSLALIKRAATDDRNFVKKGVNWALRAVGLRSLKLNTAAIKLAKQLAESEDATRRWVGKDALRALTKPEVRRRLEKKAKTGR